MTHSHFHVAGHDMWRDRHVLTKALRLRIQFRWDQGVLQIFVLDHLSAEELKAMILTRLDAFGADVYRP